MQQHHVAGRHFLQRGEHGFHIQAVGRIHIGVMADLEAGATKDGLVDRPGRVAQPDAAAGQVALDELRRQAQGAGAARSLGGAGAAGGFQRVAGAQHQVQQQATEGRVTVAADVGLGGFDIHQALFGQLHCMGDRRQALGVLVDTHAQVQLGRVGVKAVRIHQPENGVAGHPADLGEMAHLRPSAVSATWSVRADMMKSLRCRPLASWLHQVTVTLPHSVSRPGW
ncbi:hypothetical protein D9M71_474100 [compost metagenome]